MELCPCRHVTLSLTESAKLLRLHKNARVTRLHVTVLIKILRVTPRPPGHGTEQGTQGFFRARIRGRGSCENSYPRHSPRRPPFHTRTGGRTRCARFSPRPSTSIPPRAAHSSRAEMHSANVRAAQPRPDRRLSTLVRHLLPAATATSADSASLEAFPTMASSQGSSVFAGLAQAPEDPILGVTVAYNKDPSPVKVNLGVGAYRTEEGKPLVLNVVRRAENMLINNPSRVKEYLPITGLADFNKLSAKLIFGADSPAIQENRVATVQCLSGTGSLRVGGEFLARHYHERTIYIPQPTWGNHPKVFTLAGLTVRSYRYYDPATRGLDFQGLLEDLSSAPSGAIVLLHACAHNPTGVDPTLDQWEQIRQLMRSEALLPFFDSAYQGFASGSLDKDAQSVRMFVADGGELLMAQSYAKNMGLYGERVGALSIVCGSADVAVRVESQLKLVIRPMYSNPPIHGASIVATILKDSDMFNEWTMELKAMADRIISMRQQLFNALNIRETPGDWSHIIKQIGMFTFTGLDSDQVAFMRQEYHIYMTSDGRISMAGLSARTIPHLADGIHAAVTKLK